IPPPPAGARSGRGRSRDLRPAPCPREGDAPSDPPAWGTRSRAGKARRKRVKSPWACLARAAQRARHEDGEGEESDGDVTENLGGQPVRAPLAKPGADSGRRADSRGRGHHALHAHRSRMMTGGAFGPAPLRYASVLRNWYG